MLEPVSESTCTRAPALPHTERAAVSLDTALEQVDTGGPGSRDRQLGRPDTDELDREPG